MSNEIYQVIHDKIIAFRINLNHSKLPPGEINKIDAGLFNLEKEIFIEVEKVLKNDNLHTPNKD